MRRILHAFWVLFVCAISTKSFGQATTLADGNIASANIGPGILNTNPSVSNPVANFSLVQAGSNANLTQVKFTTSGTYSPTTDITAFTLYVNSNGINSVVGSTLVPSATVTATAAGVQTINLSTPFALSTGVLEYYFFIIPTVGVSAVSGHTISVASIPASGITVSAGTVTGSTLATGTTTIVNPIITGTTPGSRCGTGTVPLGATASAGATINWYSALTGGASLVSGGSYTTPSIASTTPYYAEASQQVTIQTGTLSDVPVNMATYQMDQRVDLHWFSSTNAVTINSVDVFPSATGPIVITMSSSSGIIATSPAYTITAAQLSSTVPVTIPLGFSVPAGATNYELGGDASFSTTEAYINRGFATTYGPYPTNVNGFSLTGDAATGAGFVGYGSRCYFYNWNISFNTAGAPRSTITATINPVPSSVSAAATPNPLCANSNLTLTGAATGATNYLWTGPGGTPITSPASLVTGVTGVAAGNTGVYSLVASIGSCSVTATTATVTVNPLPTPNFTTAPSANVCVGGSTTYVTQASQSSYNWSVPGTSGIDYLVAVGGIGNSNNAATIQWLTAGPKTVTVNYSSAAGCPGTSAATSTITVNALPVPTFTSSPAANICVGNSATYTTQASQSAYTWSIPGTTGADYNITSGSTGGNTVTLTWLTTGSKNVTVGYTNSNSCASAAPGSSTTFVNPLPTAVTASATPSALCAGGNLALNGAATGASTYRWTGPGGTPINAPSALSTGVTGVTAGNSGTYTLTAALGICSVTATTAAVTVNPLPTPTFTFAPGITTCIGSNVTYTTQAGQSAYAWALSGTAGIDYTIVSGGTGSGSNTVTLKWITAGFNTVSVNYTNANGCTGTPASNTTNVTSLPVPTFNSTPDVSVCANTSVTYATQDEQASYSWVVPGVPGVDYIVTAGGTGVGNSNVTLTWLTAGTKTVTVNYVDENGCPGSSVISNTTTVNALPVPSFISSPGANTCAFGDVTYTTQPGQSSYTWNLPGFSGLDYTIISGGTSTTDNTVTLNWATPGSTTVTVGYTDANSCTDANPASSTTTVNALPVPEFSTTPGENVCADINVTYATQAGQSSYSWALPGVAGVDYHIVSGGAGSGNSTVTLYWVTPGNQTVTVNYVDAHGCTGAFAAVNTTLINPAPAPIGGSGQVCVASNLLLSDDSTGGSWSGTNSSVAPVNPLSGFMTGVSPGTTTVTYTLPTGCNVSRTISVNPLPSAIAGNKQVCVGLSTPLTDTALGGTWSSFNTNASMGLLSGAMTGLSAGTSVIIYTLPTGCFATTLVTINPLSPILGITSICSGLTSTLSDSTAGGEWSSDNTAAITIDPFFGTVNSVDPGLANIAYTLPTGCTAHSAIVVALAPPAISGDSVLCSGTTTSLSDAGSGTWTSSNGSVATVIAGLGVVGGVSAGTATITYRIGSGCTARQTLTVNASPSVITGATSLCGTASTTLHDAITGGVWSGANGSGSINVDPVLGTVTGVSVGSATVMYSLPTGCPAIANIMVNPLPAAITGLTNLCASGATSLGDTSAGGMWSSGNTALATVNATTGVVSGISGSPVITYTLPTGCSASVSLSVNPLPASYTVTGGGAYCAGSGGVHVGLTGSVNGISYQLFYGITHVGASVTGTGSPLDFGLQTLAETYTIIATDSATGCSRNMAGNAPIVMNPLPAVNTVTGGGSYCASGSGVHVGLDGSAAGVSYQVIYASLPNGPAVTGSGSTIDFGLKTAAGAYTVVATNIATACASAMAGSAVVVINPSVTPSVSISTPTGDTACAGSLLTITATPVNGGPTPSYSWTVNGLPVFVSGGAYSYYPAPGDIISTVMTSSAPCASPATIASAALAPHVLPSGSPAIHIHATSGDTVCKGTLVDFVPSTIFEGPVPAYAWMVNGVVVSASSTYEYTPANHDNISCILTSDYVCRTTDADTSNTIVMQADSAIAPVVTITASPGTTVPQGSTVTFATTVANGGAAPSYQWYVNGTPVTGAGASAFASGSLPNGAVVTCKVTGDAVCPGLIGYGSITIHEIGEGVQQVASGGSNIKLVPNPNKGTFTIRGSLAAAGDDEVALVVTDILGQVVYSGKTIAVNGQIEEQVTLNNTLSNGMYLLSIHSAAEQAIFHMIIER